MAIAQRLLIILLCIVLCFNFCRFFILSGSSYQPVSVVTILEAFTELGADTDGLFSAAGELFYDLGTIGDFVSRYFTEFFDGGGNIFQRIGNFLLYIGSTIGAIVKLLFDTIPFLGAFFKFAQKLFTSIMNFFIKIFGISYVSPSGSSWGT